MFRASSAHPSGGYSCTRAAYGIVTLYESSWWPIGTQLTLRIIHKIETGICYRTVPPEMPTQGFVIRKEKNFQ